MNVYPIQVYEWFKRFKSGREIDNDEKSSRPRLIYLYHSKGIIHKEFVPRGQTITDEFYRGFEAIDRENLSCTV